MLAPPVIVWPVACVVPQIFNKFAAQQEAEQGVARGMVAVNNERAVAQAAGGSQHGAFFRAHQASDGNIAWPGPSAPPDSSAAVKALQ